MATTQRSSGRAVSMPVGLLIAAGFMALWTIFGALAVGKMIDIGIIQEMSIGYGIALILLSGSFGGAMISWSKIKRQRVLVCMYSGIIYFLILLCVTALFFGGQYSGVGVTALLIFAGAGAAALRGLSSGGGKRHRIHKFRTG